MPEQFSDTSVKISILLRDPSKKSSSLNSFEGFHSQQIQMIKQRVSEIDCKIKHVRKKTEWSQQQF